jgi:predicted dehydrogenase
MASKVHNVGIVGYGLSAKNFHIPFISDVPELKLYAVVQRNPKPNDNVENDRPDIQCYRSVEELLKDPQVDVVIVTTSPDTHLGLTKLALEAGKHGAMFDAVALHVCTCTAANSSHFRWIHVVVVEKPFTPTHEEANELIALAKENDRLLCVYQSSYSSPTIFFVELLPFSL